MWTDRTGRTTRILSLQLQMLTLHLLVCWMSDTASCMITLASAGHTTAVYYGSIALEIRQSHHARANLFRTEQKLTADSRQCMQELSSSVLQGQKKHWGWEGWMLTWCCRTDGCGVLLLPTALLPSSPPPASSCRQHQLVLGRQLMILSRVRPPLPCPPRSILPLRVRAV